MDKLDNQFLLRQELDISEEKMQELKMIQKRRSVSSSHVNHGVERRGT